MKKYKVTLTKSEVGIVEGIIKNGKRSAKLIRNALILLNVNQSKTGKKKPDEEVANMLGLTVRTIENVRKRFVMESFEDALYGKKYERLAPGKVDGEVEAHLIALSCSNPPQGHARWTLRLLSDKMVALNYVDSLSHETVRTVLKKRIKTLAPKRLADKSAK